MMNSALALIAGTVLAVFSVCGKDQKLSAADIFKWTAECFLQSAFATAALYSLLLWFPDLELYSWALLFLISYLAAGLRRKPSPFFIFPFVFSAAAVRFYPVTHLSSALLLLGALWLGHFILSSALSSISRRMDMSTVSPKIQEAVRLIMGGILLLAMGILCARYVPLFQMLEWDTELRAALFETV